MRDLEQRAADLIAVPDANRIVRSSFNGEVLAELAVDEIGPLQLFLPMAIGFDLVDEHGSLLAAMAVQVALPISVQIQPADPAAATHRIFPADGAYPYKRDLPKVEFHLINTGHFALEDKADEMVPLIRDFLTREIAS